MLQLIHASRTPADLRCRLSELGVTHVLVNRESQRRIHKVFVAGYTPADLADDLVRFDALLERWGTPIFSAGGVSIHALAPEAECPGRGWSATVAGGARSRP